MLYFCTYCIKIELIGTLNNTKITNAKTITLTKNKSDYDLLIIIHTIYDWSQTVLIKTGLSLRYANTGLDTGSYVLKVDNRINVVNDNQLNFQCNGNDTSTINVYGIKILQD